MRTFTEYFKGTASTQDLQDAYNTAEGGLHDLSQLMQGDPVLAKFGIIIGKLRDQLESLYESARGVRRMTTPGERMLGITHRPKFGA